MLGKQIGGINKHGFWRPSDREATYELLDSLEFSLVPAPRDQFHHDDAGDLKLDSRLAVKPVRRSGSPTEAVHKDVRVAGLSCRASPGILTELASKFLAIGDIAAITPHTDEL